MKIGDAYFYYQNDHLGTPQKMISENGEVVWSAKYNSFGEATIEVETVENNLRYPGQFFDAEVGLHYNRYRYYESKLGRYLRSDPIGLAGGINPFVYAINNSINMIDPLGLKWLYVRFKADGKKTWWTHWVSLSVVCKNDCPPSANEQTKEVMVEYRQWRPVAINTPKFPKMPIDNPGMINITFDMIESMKEAEKKGLQNKGFSYPVDPQKYCDTLKSEPCCFKIPKE